MMPGMFLAFGNFRISENFSDRNKQHEKATHSGHRTRGKGLRVVLPGTRYCQPGNSTEAARENLREALELFFETASRKEIQQRLHEEVCVTRLEVAVG